MSYIQANEDMNVNLQTQVQEEEEDNPELLVGMDPRFSPKNYPRADQIYKKRSSLDFDQIRTKIFSEREETWKEKLALYFAFTLTGLAIGTIGAVLKVLEYLMIKAKYGYADDITNANNENYIAAGWIYYESIALVFALIAGVLCVYMAPASQGSGIP